jgi:hypothetical protein
MAPSRNPARLYRKVNGLSYSPENPFTTWLRTPFVSLPDMRTGPMQRSRASHTCWDHPNRTLLQRRSGES